MTDSNETLERLTESTEPLERRINQYQAHLKHLDDLLKRASKDAAGIEARIDKARHERARFSEHLEMLKKMSPDEFSREIIRKSGPMGLWDAVADELEKLVERMERR